MLLIALAVLAALGVALLAVVGLVASLGAGVGVLLGVVPSLGEGVGGGLLLLGRSVGDTERGQPAGLLDHEPQVSSPENQVDEAKRLGGWEEQQGVRSSGGFAGAMRCQGFGPE